MTTPIQFKDMPWDNSVKGLSQKVYTEKSNIVRLVKINHEFIEEDWCTKNHLGYVIFGTLKVDFNGTLTTYNKGDALIIDSHKKHKIITEKDTNVEIVLFEKE